MTDGGMYSSVAPIDYRYVDPRLLEYLSADAITDYLLRVERALVATFHELGMVGQDAVDVIEAAAPMVDTQSVYAEERRIGHDIRALVNMVGVHMPPQLRRWVHLGATSYDIIDTANAARYRDVMFHVIIPALTELERALIRLALREVNTVQIGRTHGQHAVPLTFGFAIAEYINRLGHGIHALERLTHGLHGKLSGAVGAYNATSLLVEDPLDLERRVLAKLQLIAGNHSTQIVAPEPLARLLSEIALAAGVLANLARDMRHLQRTEINEVVEAQNDVAVGSSTMPHKSNPIGFENAESMYKVILGRMVTVYMDLLSEHQRDLTNSASSRTYGEIIAYFLAMVKRLTRSMQRLQVNTEQMTANFNLQGDFILAEAIYILLAKYGHPDAHEAVRQLTQQARQHDESLLQALLHDGAYAQFLDQFTSTEREILMTPGLYIGRAAQQATSVARFWAGEFAFTDI